LNGNTWTVEKVLRVQKQVVAGMNYRIVATVANKKGSTENIMFNVYVAPNDQPTLTSSVVLVMAGKSFLGM